MKSKSVLLKPSIRDGFIFLNIKKDTQLSVNIVLLSRIGLEMFLKYILRWSVKKKRSSSLM